MEMSKLEKVIKDLEAYRDRDFIREGITVFDSDPRYRKMIINNAIAMLKEQEAVEPIPYHRSDGTIFKYECRKCRTKIFKMDLFCRHCGKAVKWE